MSKPMRYDKKGEDMWAAAKRQTWEKLRTLRENIAESVVESDKKEEKIPHPGKNKRRRKQKPWWYKPKGGG